MVCTIGRGVEERLDTWINVMLHRDSANILNELVFDDSMKRDCIHKDQGNGTLSVADVDFELDGLATCMRQREREEKKKKDRYKGGQAERERRCCGVGVEERLTCASRADVDSHHAVSNRRDVFQPEMAGQNVRRRLVKHHHAAGGLQPAQG